VCGRGWNRRGEVILCKKMKHSAEYERFTALVDRVLAVPHSVIKERIDEHRRQAALNPNRRGPKPKRKAVMPSGSASDPEASGHG
jgi:hypothetical protein